MKKALIQLCALFLVLTAYAGAQISNATVNGQITDTQGAVIARATVTATNTATQLKTTVITNRDGYYTLTNLSIGNYAISVTAAGFGRYVHNNLVLTTSEVLAMDVKMSVGTASQTVEVTTSAPLVEARTSDVTQLIESKTISDMPLANRKTMNVVQTLGAAVFLSNNIGQAPVYSLAGGRVQSQMTWLDGGLTQNFRLGAGQQSIDTPIDAVQEVEVISSTYPAQYGSNSGGIIIETSKSGTNHFHGSLYEFLRNDTADARGYFATTGAKPHLRYNVFGGTVGGSIMHDRAFFFFAYEGARQHTGSTSTLTVPTTLERAGNFSQVLTATSLGTNPCDGSTIYKGQIFNPTTTAVVGGVTCRTAYTGNIISSPDVVGANIISYYPMPTNTALANNFVGSSVRFANTNYYLGKVDGVLTHRDRLLARVQFYQNSMNATSVYPDNGADPTTFPDGGTVTAFVSETHTFNSAMVNNFGVSFYRRTGTQFGFAYGGNYPTKLGLTGVPTVSFPSIAPSGYQSIGQASQSPGTVLTQEQLTDDFTWVIVRHTLKMGGEWRGSRSNGIEQAATSSGAFTFTTQSTAEGLAANAATTGNSLASLLSGDPFTFSISNGVPIDRREQYMGAYLQDDWNVSQRLTLNLGVRWETDFPESDARNRLNGFDENQINPVSGTPGVVKFAGINYSNKAWDPNFVNFSPRIGFAYKPFDNDYTVIRGGYGIYFGAPIDNTSWSGANLGFSAQASINSPDQGITAPFYLRNGVPAVALATPVLNDSYGAVAVGTNPNTAVTYFPRHRPEEYAHQFNLTIQHQFPQSFVVTVSGLSNLGRRLSGANQSVNQITPANVAAGHTTQAYRPYPQFSNVTLIAPSNGTMNYFGGVVRIEKRFSRGLNLVSTYTQAKLLTDTNDSANPTANTLGANNGPYSSLYSRGADYGRAENDIERRFTFNTVYELPFGRGRRWLNTNRVLSAITGGWTISNLTTVQSGAGMTVVTATNNTNAFSSGSQRANVVGNPNLPRSARGITTTRPWFNTAAFSQPAAGTFGNEPVGLLYAPGYLDLDFSLLRTVKLAKGASLQLRVDAFNALNHTNFAVPNTSFGSAAFGSVTAIRGDSQRELQAGARISF